MSHVLVVDDDANTREALAALAAAEGFTTACAGSVAEARIQLVRQRPDVVMMDLRLPDGSGIDLFEDLEDRSTIETILITGHASVESAVDALRLGASDYLTKPVNLQRLKAVLSRVPKSGELRAEIGALRDELRRLGRFGRLVGRSSPMQEVYDKIARVAPTEATVLLLGESGTGKEIVARTIHELSRRRKQPFLAINCGAISPNLIENEMFGHERGSYTGADRQHKGYFEQADGGTLFLDEITETPMSLQSKLLRALQEGEIRPVGATSSKHVNVRIVAATNRNLEDEVKAGRFREDLYYRLKVFPIRLPPLRERREDIPLLAAHFLQRYAEEIGKPVGGFSQQALELMVGYNWPGNVRELQNEVQRLVIQLEPGAFATPELLSLRIRQVEGLVMRAGVAKGTLKDMMETVEKFFLLEALRDHGNNKTNAAKSLGITREGLHKKLRQYGI